MSKNESQKEYTGKKTNFVHSRSGTYYALFFGCFGLKFLPDVGHYIY